MVYTVNKRFNVGPLGLSNFMMNDLNVEHFNREKNMNIINSRILLMKKKYGDGAIHCVTINTTPMFH